MVIFFSLISLLFLVLITFLLIGNFRPKRDDGEGIKELSVLIPVKNESILEIVHGLNSTLSSEMDIKVFFVNDHSEIAREEIEAIKIDSRYTLIEPPQEIRGKKRIMRFAMEAIESEWVLWMDADLIPTQDLFTVLGENISKSTKMILLPLLPNRSSGIIRAFFDLEFLSLHAAGIGSVSNGLPLLSNAACLLVSRSAFLKTAPSRDDWQMDGGDDMFAMFAIGKAYGNSSISFIKPSQGVSSVGFPEGFKALWNQRLRWMRKSPSIENFWFKFVVCLICLSQLSLLILPFLFGLSSSFILPFLVIVFTQIIYLQIISVRFGRKDLVLFILPSIFAYPFYLLSLVIGGLILKPDWK